MATTTTRQPGGASRRRPRRSAVPAPNTATRRARRPAADRRPPPPTVFRRRRLTAVLVVLAVAGALVAGGWWVLHESGLANVTGVRVTGNATIPESAVTDAAAVQLGRPLAEVDTAALASRVATLPAVATVRVELSWPHTVAVEIVERVPVATVDTPTGPQLVDATGTAYAGTPPPGLPRLTLSTVGPGDPSTTAALTALGDLPPAVRPQVQSVDVTIAAAQTPGQVTFELTDDRQVVWGSVDREQAKATVLTPLLTQPGHVYDVASPDLPTIRR